MNNQRIKIRRNKIVYLDMTVMDEQNTVLESTDGQTPFSYLHGRNNLLPALEDALQGQTLGFETSISLVPEQAFGLHQDDCQLEVPIENFSTDVTLQTGGWVEVQGPHGKMSLQIVGVTETHVNLDANHPYAGKTLIFLLKVLQIRDAHKDEVRHRQPHPGGHHLMVSDSSWWGG